MIIIIMIINKNNNNNNNYNNTVSFSMDQVAFPSHTCTLIFCYLFIYFLIHFLGSRWGKKSLMTNHATAEDNLCHQLSCICELASVKSFKADTFERQTFVRAKQCLLSPALKLKPSRFQMILEKEIHLLTPAMQWTSTFPPSR